MVKERQRRRDSAFQKRSLRPDARQNTHSHQHAEEMKGEIFWRYRSGNRPVSLALRDAFKKKSLDPSEHAHNNLLKLRVVGCHFEGRVHEHTTFVLPIAQRAVDDLLEEGSDCVARWKGFAPPHPLAKTLFNIMVERYLKEGALVTERVVKTGCCDPHFVHEIFD